MGTAQERPYHHGNLAAALVEAATALVRAGGPEAVALREVTRAVGVSPNAAYRHFADRDALVDAVGSHARDLAAAAMRARIGAVASPDRPTAPGRRRAALARLRAVGLGYVDFAIAEPSLFQLAFRGLGDLPEGADAPAPFRLLVAALDDAVATGALPAARRPGAEWACWSGVHGVADLVTRGPLHAVPIEHLVPLVEQVVDRTVEGVLGRRLPAAERTAERP